VFSDNQGWERSGIWSNGAICDASGEQFEDETWSDQGDRGTGVFSHRFDIQEFSAITALRAEMLSRVLPHTAIADRCKIEKTAMEVRGQLGTYRIQLGWGPPR
jgi:hypothetical protein